MIIGLNGFARSGKDTIAEFLVREHGFVRIGFGDAMREVLYAINPIVAVVEDGWLDRRADQPYKIIRLRNIINTVGWEGYKETPYGQEIRELLQRTGTEAGREVFGDQFWMDIVTKRIRKTNSHVVISDVRFSDECDYIHNMGGEVIRVVRSGIGPVNNHISDQQLPDEKIDFVVLNNGTIEDLEMEIEAILSSQLGIAV